MTRSSTIDSRLAVQLWSPLITLSWVFLAFFNLFTSPSRPEISPMRLVIWSPWWSIQWFTLLNSSPTFQLLPWMASSPLLVMTRVHNSLPSHSMAMWEICDFRALHSLSKLSTFHITQFWWSISSKRSSCTLFSKVKIQGRVQRWGEVKCWMAWVTCVRVCATRQINPRRFSPKVLQTL